MEAPAQDQPWSHGGDNFEMMAGVTDETDFPNFFETDFDQEFPLFNQTAGSAGEHSQQQNNLHDVLDPQLMQHGQSAQQQQLQRQPHLASNTHDNISPNFVAAGADQNGNAIFGNMQHGAFDQGQVFMTEAGQFNPHNAVPPTPNSMKMHSDPRQYIQQMDAHTRAALEQQYQLRKEGMMNFTPLVSPAVTPQDVSFQMSQDFTTVPGAYLSPLTSPALEGQAGQGTPHFRPSGHHSNSSTTTSPIDIDINMLGDPAVPQPTSAPKKASSRKRPGTAGSAAARVRQSPLAKARESKRRSVLSQPQPKEVSALLDEATRSGKSSPGKPGPLSVPGSSSEGGSISPEPLSEAVMGPPPKPGSAVQSPSINAQIEQARAAAGLSPATPASIMRIHGKADASGAGHMSPSTAAQQALRRNAHSLEDLTLPEAAVTGPAGATPRASAQATPKLGPLNTSAVSTPIASPLTPNFSTAAGSKRGSSTDAKSGRGKKRNSTSISEGRPQAPTNNSFTSPALRPKVSISPSIKPQLKQAPANIAAASPAIPPQSPITISENTAHLLLASKSNYQHLVDGTNVHVPGLEYPESLSTGLTSKRTSHKIAEQGRRNRINVALQEMGRLIPTQYRGVKSPSLNAQQSPADEANTPTSPSAKKGAATPAAASASATSASASAAAAAANNLNSGNSKAATVENAIVYIRDLQKTQAELDAIMRVKDAEIEALRRKLGMTSTSVSSVDNDGEEEAEEHDEEEEDGGRDAKRDNGAEDDAVGDEPETETDELVRAKDDGKDSDMNVDSRMVDG